MISTQVEDLRPLTRKLKLLVALDLRGNDADEPVVVRAFLENNLPNVHHERDDAPEPPKAPPSRAGARLAVRTAVDDELYAMLKNRARKRAEAK